MNVLPSDSAFNVVVLILLILFLLGFALLLIAIYKFLSKWLGFLQGEKISGAEEMRSEAYQKSVEIVDSARDESLKLVQGANAKAQAILAEAGEVSDQSKASIDKALQELAEKQEQVLKGVLEKQKDIGLHTIEQTTKEIQRGVLAEISQFEDIVHKETVESEKLVEEKVNKDYEKVKNEIAKYRGEEMTKIDESIFNILKEVSTGVLGRALSMEEHRELVLSALEEAKRRNLFEVHTK